MSEVRELLHQREVGAHAAANANGARAAAFATSAKACHTNCCLPLHRPCVGLLASRADDDPTPSFPHAPIPTCTWVVHQNLIRRLHCMQRMLLEPANMLWTQSNAGTAGSPIALLQANRPAATAFATARGQPQPWAPGPQAGMAGHSAAGHAQPRSVFLDCRAWLSCT